MAENDLNELRALLETATPGKWAVDRVFWKIGSTRGMRDEFWTTVEADGSIVATMPEEARESKPNAALIAAAVNALPALLDEIEAGRNLRAGVEALADKWEDDRLNTVIDKEAAAYLLRVLLVEVTP